MNPTFLHLRTHSAFNNSSPRLTAFFAAITALFFVAAINDAHAQFTFATDNTGNSAYSDGWQNGDNGGSGFNAWSLTTSGTGGQAGFFTDNPANKGISGMSNPSWGMYGNTGAAANADRSLSTAMGVGDTFSLQWGINFDTGAGNKGFNLFVGGTEVVNVNNGNSSAITFNGSNVGFNYGTAAMTWSFSYINPTTLSVSANDRDGSGTFSTNITVSGGVSAFRYYISGNNNGGNAEPYYNNLLSTNSGVFTQGGTITNNNAFSGGGNLSIGNTTTLALGGNLTYTGTTTISNNSTLRLQSSGTVNFASALSGGGAIVISNGSGQVNFSGTGTGFTGAITLADGTLEARSANALGATNGGTTVQSGAALKLFNASTMSMASEGLTLTGTGVGGNNGALRSVGGTNTWNGAITLGGNARINADTTGGAGSLTIAGNITGGNNVLFLGANGANITLGGALSGGGASQDLTTTSIFKDGANNLTLSGNNSYSGDTRLVAGSLTVAAGGTLGNGDSDVFISSGATLNVNTNVTVDSVRETGNNNGGVIAIASGATLTVDGTNKGTFFQNNISGAGGLTMAGSGDTLLGLYGTQSYTGTTTVSGGKLSSGVALATTNVTVTGGEFETTAANILADTASVIVNGGLLTLGGNDTIGALSGNGGTFALGTNALTTSTSANTSFAGALTGSGAVVKQGTGSITLSGANTATGGLFIDNGAVTLGGGSVAFTGIEIGGGINGGAQPGNAAALRVTSGSYSTPITVNGNTNSSGVAGIRTIEFANASGSATLSGNVTAEKTFTANVATGAATGVLSGVISGAGGLTKTGDGTLTISGASGNSYTGATLISGGTINANKASGNAITGDLTIASGATLLLSSSDQVASSGGQTVTLSGGTITRGGNVSEVFGNLNLTAGSFLDYGAANDIGTLRFGTYTPSALLTVNNFLPGNKLQFGNTISSTDLNNATLFSFSSGFTTSTEDGFFTITAIPEPSTYVAAAGLLALFLWPVRRRLIKDAKSILGLRPNGRDRIESYRNA